MSLRLRMATGVVIGALVSASLVGMLLVSVVMSQRADESVAHAGQVSDAMFDLVLLTGDFTIVPGERSASQWRTRYENLNELLDAESASDVRFVLLSDTLRSDYDHLGVLFSELSKHTLGELAEQDGLCSYSLRISDQLRITAQSLATKTQTFEEELREEQADARERILMLAVMLAVASVAFLSVLTWSTWKSVAEPLTRLQEGARALAAGNLEHRFGATRHDEAGEVARAFDEMADALAASHRALEAEVAERRSAEQRVRESKTGVERLVERRTVQLLRANRELNEATAAKDRLMARMSHELLTPLNSVIGFTTILKSGAAGPVTAEQNTQLQMISKSGKRLLELVSDLLDFSAIAVGGIEIVCEELDIAQFGCDLISAAEPLAHARGLDFEYECTATDTIYTDRARLEQVMMNLVGNAAKFTEQGHIGLSISSTPQGGARLTVSDSGIGIAPERLVEVFDEFTQLRPPQNRVHEGTGLGLAIARGITEALGGSITVQSTPGEGSTFTVTLPKSAPECAC